jgi:translation initiation factor 3 subunit H
MKIIKQCRDFFPSSCSGHLLGLDINGTLQITNSYPLPSSQDDLPPGANLETERRRQQALWIKGLSEVNVDDNLVGWYQNAYLGNFMNSKVVDGLIAAGQNQRLNDKAVFIINGTLPFLFARCFLRARVLRGVEGLCLKRMLIVDVSKSASGPLSLRAFRLTPSFLAAHKDGKFTVERYPFSIPQ